MEINPIGFDPRIEQSRKTARQSGQEPARISGENVELSGGAGLSESVRAAIESARAHIEQAAEVRSDRVEEVRQRIREGYYETGDFIDRLSAKMADDLGLRE